MSSKQKQDLRVGKKDSVKHRCHVVSWNLKYISKGTDAV